MRSADAASAAPAQRGARERGRACRRGRAAGVAGRAAAGRRALTAAPRGRRVGRQSDGERVSAELAWLDEQLGQALVADVDERVSALLATDVGSFAVTALFARAAD